VTCRDCSWRRRLDRGTRLRLSQENKEILNKLLRQGYDIGEFIYCERLGYIESVIAHKECEEWEFDEPKFEVTEETKKK
jgi:precorrin-6B methylase 1